MNDEDAIEQFRLFCEDYILRHGCTGEDGGGAKRQFISRKALAAYWTREKITTVLCSRDNLIIANSETILRHYSVAFSILVLMSRPEQIHLFTRADINDSKLPLLSPPPSYPNAPEATIIGDFMRNQWKFCPLTFGHTSGSFPDKRDISPHQILPIIEKEKLKSTADEEEDDSVLYKVKLHPDCTDISDYVSHEDLSGGHIYVCKTDSWRIQVAFKVYAREDSETEQFYENEASMYSHLSKESFDHIVTYRGSFRQSGKRTVVLQYALGDTLQAFFKSQSPPQSFADRVQFLSNLLDLLKGLHAIQDLTRNHHHSIATHRLKGFVLASNALAVPVDSMLTRDLLQNASRHQTSEHPGLRELVGERILCSFQGRRLGEKPYPHGQEWRHRPGCRGPIRQRDVQYV